MNPNDPYQNQQPPEQTAYSIDYLNQISAPPPARPKLPRWALFAGIAAFLVTLLVGGLILFVASAPKVNDKTLSYLLRVQTLKAIATEQQTNLRNSPLRNRNSSLILLLTGAETNINDQIKQQAINIKDLAKTPLAAREKSYRDALSTEINTSRLNATLDQTYPREMAYQLRSMLNMLTTIRKMTKSTSYKEYIDTTVQDIEPIIKTLETM